MTRSELIEALAAKCPALTTADVTAATKVILEAIGAALEEGGRIEIRGFGSFSTVVRSARIGRNPKTGQRVEVPARRVLHFKPGLELRKRVDKAPHRARAPRQTALRMVRAGGAEPELDDVPRRKNDLAAYEPR